MAQCHNCGAQVAEGTAACPECGARFTHDQGHQHQQPQGEHPPQQAQPRQMTDGGDDSSAIGALVGVLSIIYSLLNLVLAATFLLGASILGNASQAAQDSGAQGAQQVSQAAGDAGILATIYGLVFLVLTIGFLAGAIGTFSDADWGWPLMAGTWALNLVFSLLQLVLAPSGEVSIDVIAIVFIAINVVVLGWIYSRKKQQLPIGDGQQQQPMR